MIQAEVGLFLSVWYSLCRLYKYVMQYNNIKYLLSLSRNVSRFTGFVCSTYVPYYIRYPFYGSFAKFYGINMEEVEISDFGHYTTFTKFFTRHLKEGVRQVSEPKNGKSMCSPCDGRVLSYGVVDSENSTIDCVKGRSYKLSEFMLGNEGSKLEDNEKWSVQAMVDKVKARGNQLLYMVIYLSPADYHCFHSPAIHTADYRRHVAGYLSPVKPSYVNKHKDTFKNNERVNIFGRWEQGFYFESAVGATNVGSVKLDFDTEVLTNKPVPQFPYFEDKNYVSTDSNPFKEYINAQSFDNVSADKNAKQFVKSEMTGRFEMGSTIVLVFEADQDTKLLVHEGKKLWLGQSIVSHP